MGLQGEPADGAKSVEELIAQVQADRAQRSSLYDIDRSSTRSISWSCNGAGVSSPASRAGARSRMARPSRPPPCAASTSRSAAHQRAGAGRPARPGHRRRSPWSMSRCTTRTSPASTATGLPIRGDEYRRAHRRDTVTIQRAGDVIPQIVRVKLDGRQTPSLSFPRAADLRLSIRAGVEETGKEDGGDARAS